MDWRRTLILLVTIGLMIGAFTVYRHFFTFDIPQGNDPNFSMDNQMDWGQGISVGRDTDVMDANGCNLVDRDETGAITKEWGFARLEYRTASVSGVVEPYLRLYQPDMTIEVNARFGLVALESVVNRMNFKDVTFKDEVCVHLSPTDQSTVEECWIRMDEMVFIRERAEFTSHGEIRVHSQSLDMQGKDLKFVYNELKTKVQFFRLEHLEQMLVRIPKNRVQKSGFFFGDQVPVPQPDSSAVLLTPSDKKEDLTKVLVAATAGQLYHCQLHRNVMFQTPEQAIYSSEGVILTHILWPKGALGRRMPQSDPNDPHDAQDADQVTSSTQTVASDVNTPMTELSITCDGGVTIIPMGMDWPQETLEAEVDQEQDRTEALAQLSEGQSWFAARQITHHVWQLDTLAQGPVEFTFYDVNLMDPEATVLLPLRVTAQDRAVYEPNTNDIVFTGGCECVLVRTDPNKIERYFLSAQRLKACMADDKDERAIAASADVERILADGNDVVLRILTADPNRVHDPEAIGPEDVMVGGEMECLRCDYHPEPGREVFTAMGPGAIRLNNSLGKYSTDPNEDKEPYYAFIRDFEVLQFFQADYRIVADAQERSMELIYIPTLNGESRSEITAQADHVEITLVNNDFGELEIKSLLATGNVFCRKEEHELSAYALSYDRDEGVVKMWGDLQQVCYVDGVPVPGIELNLLNGDLNFEIIGPSSLPLAQ